MTVGWFARLRPEAAACRKSGIRRLTSDIGPRPSARCPARERCVTAEAVAAGERTDEAVGPRQGTSSRLQLHHARCPDPVSDAGVVAGEFSPFENGFWETYSLSGLMVT